MGNMLCRAMQKHPKVLFAGYRVPHPLEHHFVLKVQTDSTLSPLDALQQTVNGLLQDLTLLEEQVKVNEVSITI